MEFPGVGPIVEDKYGWQVNGNVVVPAFGPEEREIFLEDYEPEDSRREYHRALRNLMRAGPELLTAATADVYRYFCDMNEELEPGDPEYLVIERPGDVWQHVQIGTEIVLSRRRGDDPVVYASIECNCDWEPEHGLQLVFRSGLHICKVGAFDGHLTNVDAYADPSLEGVVYRER